MIFEVDWLQSLVVGDAESIYEVNFGSANFSVSHQLKYINTVSWIGGNVAVTFKFHPTEQNPLVLTTSVAHHFTNSI